MRTEEIIEKIHTSKKTTPAKCYLRTKGPLDQELYPMIRFFGDDKSTFAVLFGECEAIEKWIKSSKGYHRYGARGSGKKSSNTTIRNQSFKCQN